MDSQRSQIRGKHGAGTGTRDSATARGLSHEAIKLLKTQDAGYLRVIGEKVRREMEKVSRDVRLQEGVQEVLGGGGDGDGDGDGEEDHDDDGFDFDGDDSGKSRKVVFTDSQKGQRELKNRIEDQEEEEEEDDDDDESFSKRLQQQQQHKKSQKQLNVERQALAESRRARKMKKRASEARKHKLESLTRQHREIVAAERELEWQRGKMDNSVGGTNKDGIKWKIRERKR